MSFSARRLALVLGSGMAPVTGRIRRLETKLGIKRFNLYAYRHTFVTDALAKGISADVVAELVAMLCRNVPSNTSANFVRHVIAVFWFTYGIAYASGK